MVVYILQYTSAHESGEIIKIHQVRPTPRRPHSSLQRLHRSPDDRELRLGTCVRIFYTHTYNIILCIWVPTLEYIRCSSRRGFVDVWYTCAGGGLFKLADAVTAHRMINLRTIRCWTVGKKLILNIIYIIQYFTCLSAITAIRACVCAGTDKDYR